MDIVAVGGGVSADPPKLNYCLKPSTICSMKQKILSKLEQEVMNIVWNLGQCTVRDVLVRMSKDKTLAYTTIATILQRLFEKGFVGRNEKSMVVSFSPKITKDQYGKKLAQSFFTGFFHSFGDAAVVSFAESIEKLPKNKKEYLLKLLTENETK